MQATLLQRPGKENYLAVSLKIAEGWHLYWKNPGDAGIPPSFSFLKGTQKIPMDALEWPSPKKYTEGECVKELLATANRLFSFLVFHRWPGKVLPGSEITLKGKWLVCERNLHSRRGTP